MFSPHHPHPTPQHTYSLASFRNFSLILCFLNMECLGIDFFFFTFNHLVFLRFPGPVIWFCICLGNYLGLYYWYVRYFFRFFLLLLFPLHVYYTIVLVPQFLDILGVLFCFFFLFAFQFWKFLLMYLQASWFSSPPCPVRWWAHQIHYSFLFSATSYLLMSLPFNFLLKARHDILDIKNQVK